MTDFFRCKLCGQPAGCAAVVKTPDGADHPCIDSCHSAAWQAVRVGHKIMNPEPEPRQARITDLEAWRPILIKYLEQKYKAEDWHGVQDAASDLRDLDSEMDGLRY